MLLRDWIKFTQSSNNAVLLGVLVIGLVAVYNWAIRPHENYLQASQRYQIVRNDLVTENQIIAKDIKIKNGELSQLQRQYDEICNRLFEFEEGVDFFENIQDLAKNADCGLKRINFSLGGRNKRVGQSNEDDSIVTNRAAFTIIGSYESIANFLCDLQNRNEQVSINSFGIESAVKSTGQLDCDITITAFVMKDKEKLLDD